MAFGRSKKTYEAKHDVRWLVAGLGNPGREYEDTPHNIGFAVVEAIAASRRASWSSTPTSTRPRSRIMRSAKASSRALRAAKSVCPASAADGT